MRKIYISILLLIVAIPCYCCTSVIISSRYSTSGRPVMMKHRDTGELDNRIERFKGEKYDFVALVNSNWASEPTCKYGYLGEAWSGTNSAGFCIMNTATYDLKDDNVPVEEMDREGVVMFRALGECATVADFERLLDSMPRPLGVEANFGVIDASGGAAYYEVNNYKWVKFDVNSAEGGYMVVTNFTRTGRVADRKGVDRFEKASEIMKKSGNKDHKWLINNISRSGSPILRDITSASIVFEGVAPGDDPLHTVMWTALGYPASTVYIPVLVLDSDHVPFYLKANVPGANAIFCDNALKMKGKDVSSAILSTEKIIDNRFSNVYRRWVSGRLSYRQFLTLYDSMISRYYPVYNKNFSEYLR